MCIRDSSYNLIVDIFGGGTYSISDGGTILSSGVTSGEYTFGPLQNGQSFNISIQSDVDPDCIQNFAGIENCFECDLTVNANQVCLDLNSYQVDLNVTGSGTYTITDGNTTQSGVTAGLISFGPYNNNQTYSINILSDLESSCSETISGVNDCFECDLGIVTTNTCLNLDGYEVTMEISGGGTFSCLLYTSPSPRDATLSRMPSSA